VDHGARVGRAPDRLPGGRAPLAARRRRAGEQDTTVTTKHLGEGIAADYDSDGRLAGIEILDAIRRLGDPAVLRQVILEGVGPAA
jgi:uncharacterized protein YuzE